jgi:hypothetical protein
MYHVIDYSTYQLRNPDQRKQVIEQSVGLLRSPWLGKNFFLVIVSEDSHVLKYSIRGQFCLNTSQKALKCGNTLSEVRSTCETDDQTTVKHAIIGLLMYMLKHRISRLYCWHNINV